MNTRLRNVPFSPPDITEVEANEVRDAILSGWITTGPRTKKLEKVISEYVHTQKTVCLNSATAAMEMVLHLLGIGPGDEVIAFDKVKDAIRSALEKRIEEESQPDYLKK